MHQVNDDILSRLQPIVLVGGRSSRFGRDKLREPMAGNASRWMVDAPIDALREVFGARVALVGECHADVAQRGDFVIHDEYAGLGPAGGLLSALEFCANTDLTRDVFVLAGDLPRITADAVRTIVNAYAGEIAQAQAADSSNADSEFATEAHPLLVVGATPGIEPCIGIYRQQVRSILANRLRAGRASLHDVVDAGRMLLVPIDAGEAANVNTSDAVPPQ